MACKAKESGKVSRRGEPSIEWYKDGKPQYYCYGYIDKMTDELLPECKECQSHVYKAQDDIDKYNRCAGEEDRPGMVEKKGEPVGLKGPVAWCPSCGAKDIKWDAEKDICLCMTCGRIIK